MNYWFDAENHIDKRIVEAVEKIKKSGIKCYLATNQERYRTQYLRNEMGFSKIFDEVFSSAEVGYKKPQPEFFEYILKEIGLNKDEIQFWDDTEKNIQGAKEFGFDAQLYQNFEGFAANLNGLGIKI